MKITVTALLCAFAAVPVCGQAAPNAMIVGAPAGPVLRMGTEVPVHLRTELTTERKALRVGQRFEVETFEPVTLSGHVVIPSGTPGVGEITGVTNKGMWGKSGHLDLRLLYLRVGDRQIRIRGTDDKKGKAGGVGAAAVSAIVFLPAGFFMTGTSARLPAGTVINGYLDEDVPVAFAASETAVPIVAAAPLATGVATAPASTVQAPALIKVATPSQH